MADQPRPRTTRSLRLGLLVAAIIGVVTGLFAWHQVQNERAIDLDDVGRRAHALAQQLSDRVLYALTLPDIQARALLQPRVEGYQRLLGYAVFRADGRLVAAGKTISDFTNKLDGPMREALQSGNEVTQLTRGAGMQVHVFAKKFPEKGDAEGVLVVVHDVSYIDDRALARLAQFAFWVLIVSLLAVALVVGSTWFVYERPLTKLADWMRRLRVDNVAESPPPGLPSGRLRSESDRLAASFRAARSTGRALSEAALFAEQVWTPERLRAHAVASLGEAHQLIVVSNREPYMHQWRDGRGYAIVPAGGLVTALDPVLQACGGVWIAHGAGNADRANADAEGRLTVPPGDMRYTLKRVWLTREEEQGYYYGFSNEGLWPLCHLAHERPVFRAEDWEHYRQANRRFADAVLDEAGSGKAVVLVQDYQLALVPRMLKEARPDLRVGMFWHIPWPNPEAFRICPWGAEILDGMLGADLLGFHLQQYCNSFLETVDRVLESRLDWDHFSAELRGSRTRVRPFPISVQPWSERHVPGEDALAKQITELRTQHQLGDVFIAVGVDRIDYTKGIPERFRAIARLLEKYPQYRGRFTFVELGAPSRTHIPRYREHLDGLEALADEINWKYQSEGWKPIHFLVAHHDARTVHAFLRMAPMCIVSSLHDGMNLVAKEYVAAQSGGDGVLVLSEFAGAARELADALIVNPYDTEQFAEAVRYGLEMDPGERRARMQRLTRQVEEHNIYRWAANFLAALAAERVAGTEAAGVGKAANS
ncbi:alpha,alpha-trehalose-phosphate synthase [Sulfuricaulis limicola]|uniref:Alpha,alpha-trehalose-phosphate synthase n=1 Tax=Sulfuricaulis limicola TaxID=1620215 RepID=A0A1B4XHK4_9GAMM|nr:trehalose-6-phosphate synthase [Sulfuricaulis limicola]BAV34291.1 alpha,alpha-trehalose-phosphate synthase [Sulfuricaulis limicola]